MVFVLNAPSFRVKQKNYSKTEETETFLKETETFSFGKAAKQTLKTYFCTISAVWKILSDSCVSVSEH